MKKQKKKILPKAFDKDALYILHWLLNNSCATHTGRLYHDYITSMTSVLDKTDKKQTKQTKDRHNDLA